MAVLILKKFFLILMCLTVPVGALAADADDKDALFGVSHDAQKLQLSVRRIGQANLVCARTRPKFIGGQRAQYDPLLL